MDNEIAYEILRLIRDKKLHSHSEVHEELIMNPNFINATPSDTLDAWRRLKGNYCIIDKLAFDDAEYMAKYPSTKKEQTYETLNPARDCFDTYRKLAAEQIKVKRTEGRKNWKERNWIWIGVISFVLGVVSTIILEKWLERLNILSSTTYKTESLKSVQPTSAVQSHVSVDSSK